MPKTLQKIFLKLNHYNINLTVGFEFKVDNDETEEAQPTAPATTECMTDSS